MKREIRGKDGGEEKKNKKEKLASVHFGLAAVQKRCNLVTSAKFGQRSPPRPKKEREGFQFIYVRHDHKRLNVPRTKAFSFFSSKEH